MYYILLCFTVPATKSSESGTEIELELDEEMWCHCQEPEYGYAVYILFSLAEMLFSLFKVSKHFLHFILFQVYDQMRGKWRRVSYLVSWVNNAIIKI